MSQTLAIIVCTRSCRTVPSAHSLGPEVKTFWTVPALNYPTGVVADDEGNIIVTDNDNHRVHKIAPDSTVSTLVGSGRAGLADGPGAEAQLNGPKEHPLVRPQDQPFRT